MYIKFTNESNKKIREAFISITRSQLIFNITASEAVEEGDRFDILYDLENSRIKLNKHETSDFVVRKSGIKGRLKYIAIKNSAFKISKGRYYKEDGYYVKL